MHGVECIVHWPSIPCSLARSASLSTASLLYLDLNRAPYNLYGVKFVDPVSLDLVSLDLVSLDLVALDPVSLDPAPLDPVSLDSVPLGSVTRCPVPLNKYC